MFIIRSKGRLENEKPSEGSVGAVYPRWQGRQAHKVACRAIVACGQRVRKWPLREARRSAGDIVPGQRRRPGSVEHDLVGFVFDDLVNFVGVLLGQVVNLLFAVGQVVFRDGLIFLLLLEMLDCVSSDVANGDFALLAGLLDLLDELSSSFLAEWGDIEPDEFPVDDRREAQVAVLDRLRSPLCKRGRMA